MWENYEFEIMDARKDMILLQYLGEDNRAN